MEGQQNGEGLKFAPADLIAALADLNATLYFDPTELAELIFTLSPLLV